MGNSMPTEESGAPRVPEQSGTPMVPEESGAPSVPEQSGTPMVPEESGTTSVPEGAGVSTVQDVGTASAPEGAGVAVGQERSESEADSVLGTSPSYADHVQGPATPPSVPSLGPERFSPSPAAEGRPGGDIAVASAQAEHAEDEAWGKWQAAPDAPSAPRCSFCACLSACWCGGPGAETTKERTPEWDECPVVGCVSFRRGRRKLVAPGVYERAGEAHTGSLFAGSPSPGRAGRATPFIKPCSWQALFDRSHVRLVVVCNDGPWLSYKGLTWGWLAICPRRVFGDNRTGPTRSTRRVRPRTCRHDCRRTPNQSSSGHQS